MLPHRAGSATTRFDFAALDRSGRVRALIEAKRKYRSDATWAARLRENLLGEVDVDIDFFVVAVPDRLYVWRSPAALAAPPTHVLDTTRLFAPYFQRSGVAPSAIEPLSFESLVWWWLTDHTRERETSELELARSGLRDALLGATIVREFLA